MDLRGLPQLRRSAHTTPVIRMAVEDLQANTSFTGSSSISNWGISVIPPLNITGGTPCNRLTKFGISASSPHSGWKGSSSLSVPLACPSGISNSDLVEILTYSPRRHILDIRLTLFFHFPQYIQLDPLLYLLNLLQTILFLPLLS